MILQALAKYYDRLAVDGEIAPQGCKHLGIPFIIVLEPSGRFAGLTDTRAPSGKKLLPRSFLVPEERPRSGSKAWETANLLWDHFGYVLGWPKSDAAKDKVMAERQHQSFVSEIRKLHELYPGDEEIKAVLAFLTSGDFSRVFADVSWAECTRIPGCNLTFQIAGRPGLVTDSETVRSHVISSVASESDDAEDEETGLSLSSADGACIVTGESGPIARLHPRTPIPGAKSNAKIVSFQRNMGFDSYGKEQSLNAPTSKLVAFKYSTALNKMLAKDSRQKLPVGEATTIFWADKISRLEEVFLDLFGAPGSTDPSLTSEQDLRQITALFQSPQAGLRPDLDPSTRFFVLGLAPNAARIAIRFWYSGTVGEVADHLNQHFDDIEIVRPPTQPQFLSLFRLLVSTATLGKAENIPPNLAGEFMKSILGGSPYPRSLLMTAVNRCRAERDVPYPRAALIKAVLARHTRSSHPSDKEVGMSLDPSNVNIGYRLGRLFAVLEKVQEEASPGINATIRDRFYGSAASTPVAAFPHLMKLKNHHISKLESRGRAVNLEKLIGEIMDGINDFPSHIRLEDQGRFAVGYYHQRQDFFKKSDNSKTIVQEG